MPGALAGPKGYQALAASLKSFLGRTSTITLWHAPSIDESSRPGESQADFRVRISQKLKEARDESLDGRSRLVVELLLAGENQAAIARRMGLCEGTVSRIRARAISTLRAAIEGRPDGRLS